ncbi:MULTISPECIES: LytTR family transcriptional regulator DNA-binding domain-containing protein [unclassified Sporosarcina]|uniref:LytTR family transcriptional regulator DNA-binding domain-containing protein n=1 Tax=unclassified Sporosarcina TaxID=2647733 RepID=UPI00203AFF40|nr:MULTISPECIES: LytTR family transcriptional regulator DNA-binding domain-containing protein [unclassified Sporosarcina]GKV64060.1 transcriptional regulator [Sporosarcina sp. NCCP-2331]GLB56365.1 transcriptional regulator [Sporosarcina sp. NCCP-2378]
MTLQFINAEKRIHDSMIFPSFNLTVSFGKAVAIYSSVNVREQLMEVLLEKIRLSAGEVQIAGDSYNKSKQLLGFLFLNQGLYERLSIEEMIRFTKQLYTSKISIEDTMHAVQLHSKRKVKIKELSYSERRRMQLACLLMQNPSYYIFEEADQNMDLESKRIFLTILQGLKEQGKGVLILTGNMESAVTAADEVYRLDDNGLHSIQTRDAVEDQSAADESSISAESVQPVRFEKIPTKVNDKIVLFDPPEIDYIESNEGQSFLHIKGESFSTNFTLNELEDRLLPFGFFRCHRSYIVNLQKVREVITWTRNSYSLVLDDMEKSTIPLSKTKMVELKEMLGL